ncbi:hypothetical protein M0811_04829 [Anaeramoeba ignava]|uniref:Uncharacterized protein n=1 Tax=Anaeramoeba ignava TaxID=1746090 RepID=A0A9Q0RFV4_ANAIG|nr:hypothetical protein M0811_04829 [Anaeramoeba ignava]
MEISEEELKNQIGKIKEFYEQKLKETIGKEITIEIKWETFESSKRKQRAIETLYSFQGYFIFGKLVECLSELGLKFGGGGDIQKMLDAVEISCVEKFYKNIFLKKLFPRSQKALSEILGTEIPFEVDWESFQKSNNLERSLERFSYWFGYYSFSNAVIAFRYSIQYDDLSKKKLINLIKKIVFVHIPGHGRSKRIAYIKEGVLYLCSLWEDYWYGYLRSYEIQSLLKHACAFYKLELKQKNQKFEKHQMKKLVDYLEDISSSHFVRNGHFEYMEWAISQPTISHPDDSDKTAFQILIDNYINKGKTEKHEVENYMHGWNIKKINRRGTRQDRLMVLTDKALYTMKYNYKKKQPIQKTITRYEHDDYWYVYVGELKKQGSSGLSSLAGAIGGDDAQALVESAEKTKEIFDDSKEYAIRYVTSKKNKSNPVLQTAAKKLGKKILDVFDKLVEKQIKGRDDLPEIEIPEAPKYSFTDVMHIAAKSLAKEEGALPFMPLGQFSSVSILDILAILEETFEELKNPPKIKLPNLPIIDLPWVLEIVLSTLRSMTAIEFDFPESPSLSNFFKEILKKIKKKKSSNLDDISLPSPNPITLPELLHVVLAELKKLEEPLPRVTISGFELPSIPEILELLISFTIEAPPIKLPPPKKLKILEIIEVLCSILGDLNLPSLSLKDLGISFDLPDISLDLNDIGIDLGLPSGKFLQKFKTAPKPKYQEIIFQPRNDSKPLKWQCFESAWLLRGVAMACNSPSWINSIQEHEVVYRSSFTGSLLTKTSGKSNKKTDEKPKKK